MSATHSGVIPDYKARHLALAILLIAPLAFGVLVLALGQDADWDLRNYHWYNAYAFLNNRYALDLLPSQTPFFYNPILDVPFYLLAIHVPARVTGFVLGSVQGLNFVLLFMLAHVSLKIANPRHKVLVCAALATLGMLGGGGIAMLGTVFYDNVTSLGLFLSALLVVRYHNVLLRFSGNNEAAFFLRRRKSIVHFNTRDVRLRKHDAVQAFLLAVIFGLPAGLMMGLKLPSVIFCLGLCFALLLAQGSIRRRFLISFGFGVGVLVGVGLSLGYWAWYLQTHYGSPLFPYFNEIFKSSLAPLTSARDMQFLVHGAKEMLLFPFTFMADPLKVGEIPWRDWRLPILYALLPVALLARMIFGRSRDVQNAVAHSFATRYLLCVVAISYGAWLMLFCIYRYAVPLEMLAPLAIVMAAGLLPIRPQPRAMLTGFILLVIAGSVQGGSWGRRDHWLDHTVEATIPSPAFLGDTSSLMILMAGFEPYAHLVTQFPPQVQFVRIQSNFVSPDENKGINKLLHDRVDNYHGRLMLLIPPWQHALATEALGYYGLTADWKHCQPVVDHLFVDSVVDLCAVERTAN